MAWCQADTSEDAVCNMSVILFGTLCVRSHHLWNGLWDSAASKAGISLGMGSANERWFYNVTSSLIGPLNP